MILYVPYSTVQYDRGDMMQSVSTMIWYFQTYCHIRSENKCGGKFENLFFFKFLTI